MRKSKFFRFLQTLDTKELKSFVSFAAGQATKLGVAYKILVHIAQFGPLYSEEKQLSRDFLIGHFWGVSPDRKSQKRLSDEYAKLTSVLKSFWIHQRMEELEFDRNILLAQILHRRGLAMDADKAIDVAYKSLQKMDDEQQLTADIHSQQVNKLQYHHYKYYATGITQWGTGGEDLEQALKQLDLFFIGRKLQYACEMESRGQIINASGELLFLQESIDHLEENIDKFPVWVKMYYLALEMIQRDSVVNFSILFNNLQSHELKPPEEHQKIIITYLFNFCAKKIRQGHGAFMRQLFDLYVFTAKEQLLITHNIIPLTRFHNIVDTACKVNELTWAQQFIKDYETYLPVDFRDETVGIAKAMILFENEDYRGVLELLGQGSFKREDYSLRVRWMSMCCYYALGDIASLDAQQKATRMYIKRSDKLNEEMVRATLNLMTIINKIRRYVFSGKGDKEAIISKLNQLTPIVYKVWLQKIIDKLR